MLSFLKRRRSTLFLLVLISLFVSLLYFYNNFVLYPVDISAYRYADFPSRAEVENYLFDKTFIIDDPPISNEVYFNSKEGRYFEWHDDTVYHGKWTIGWRLLPLKLTDGYTIKQVELVCRSLPLMPDGETDCTIADRLSSILDYGKNDKKTIFDGDIFHLSGHYAAPANMPDVDIDRDSLDAAIALKRKSH